MIDLTNIETGKQGIYCIINTNNGKRYIGLSRNILKRLGDHVKKLDHKKHYNKHLQAAYSNDNFTVCILEECVTENLKEREKFWIAFYNTHERNNGYNLTHGGEDLASLSDEAKETKRLNRIGKSSSLKGKTQTKEWVEARMSKLRGQKRNYTPEHIEAIRKVRQLKKGGRQKGKTVILTENGSGNVLTFSSKREAEDFLGMKRDTLIHKFYKGRPKMTLKKINYLNYTIEKT